ncbi:h domain protein [Nocardia sp. NPDC057668]|uniref:h domain protein n=1 Tax=Nocardia sp. NPDC057668 TaxID=3346202 RepID=UPI00366C592D
MRIKHTLTWPVVAIALAAIAAVLAGAGFLGYRAYEYDRLEQARENSVTAARKTVESMFSYDFKTVDATLPKVADNLAPGFQEDYLKLVKEAIAPGAKEKSLTVQATAQAGGVISVDVEHAEVLLFLNQVTTSKDKPEATTSGSRVKVSLDKDGDRWLVAEVTPV